MSHSYRTRRWLLTTAGSVTLAGLAGCSDESEPETNAETSADEGDEEHDDEHDEEHDDESDGGTQEDVDVSKWEDVDEFRFEGRAEAWTGLEPAPIEGEKNPTIVLLEGQEYDFRWVNEDGAIHDLEIWNEEGDVVDDYVSDSADSEGEEVTLTGVVASAEMESYVCMYHQGSQIGEIEVRSP